MLGEDVQDQSRAVNDFDLDHFLQSVQLGRTEFAIADHRVGGGRRDDLAQFLRFPGADVGGRVRLIATLDDPFEHLRTGGLRQRGQFGQAGVGIGRTAIHPHSDEHHSFQAKLAVFHLGYVGEFGGQPGHPTKRDPILKRKFADTRVGAGSGRIGISHRRSSMVS